MASIRLCFYDVNGVEMERLPASALNFTDESIAEMARAVYGDAELCEKRVAMVEQALLSDAISQLSEAKTRDELSPYLCKAILWPSGALAVHIIAV